MHNQILSEIVSIYLKPAPLNDLTPWYVDFKNTILSLRGITEYETFDHPVATMIAISSTDPDPVSTIMQLYNPNVPSFTIDKPYVDTNVLRYYVILHDSNLTTLEHSMAVFEKLKRTVGLHCFLLKINSKPRDPADNESIEDKTEDDIRAIWEESLSETYRIESLLQNYTADLSSTSSVVGLDATINPSATISPVSSTPGHSRSASVSSNRSSNNATPVPPATVIHGTSIQSIPIDLLDENLEQTPPVSPLPLLSEVTTIQYGRCLTREDVDNVKTMIRELTVQSLIPFMERNIQHWNEQVASARRGLTGRLFGASRRLFGSSVRSPTPQSVQSIAAQGPNVPFGVNTITIYPASSPEAQMRKLADYAFMLRDYKFAHTIYDTVRRDYATEKIYKYHAGTQEMMGICVLLMSSLQTNKTDVDRHFELAIQQYLGRCRSPFHATRATIIYYELLKSRRMWKEMPTALVRMTGEDSDLRSGLFLEQAAHCFLRTRHPMVRKYGFHLVMAGHRYGKAGQRLHAYRAYKMAAFVLEGHDWSLAQSHVQFALGRQAFHLGRLEDAVACFSNVLSDNVKQTGQQQGAHMREFLFIYRQYAMSVGLDPLKVSLPHLTLPVIDDRDIQVTLSNAQPKISQKEEWADMELAMLEDSINYGYISSSKRAMAVQQQDDHIIVCAVGEPAIVHIELYNPLQVSILLSDIMLGCQYRTSTEVEKPTTADASEEMPECKQKELNSDMYDFENFSLQKLDKIKLEPLEKMMINLKIVPHNEGSIQVTGLHYTLNELVHTFRPFSKKGRRLNRTKEELMSVTYAADRSLDILVTSPMPLLDLAFHHVPEAILSGEVIQAVLEINNKGNKGLTALRLKTSHSSFICVGNPEDMDKDIYSMNGTTPDKMDLDNQLFDSSIITIPLPARKDQEHSHEHGIVLPGETTLVPIWIRGDRIGKHMFRFLFSYQSNEDNAMIAHRTLRYTMNIQVLPSLKINAFTRPSTTAVNEYILGIEIENLQTTAKFDLTQLTIASPSWTLFPLSIDMDSSEDIVAKTTIPPRQTTFSFYKLRRLEQGNDSCPEAWTSTALGKLLNAPDTKSKDLPPPIQLNISKLSFVRTHSYKCAPLY
ncbi:MAG: ER-golgi trafficking TRAPP I complex 85 kDa subunit-domain-containing protein [Benjaminiella poitrasii]|nr:MAG: ER-golgi trafficking TRAPP I complex 85 kDa subunit-domain-containing protein [Benjaminiella poitrasii]